VTDEAILKIKAMIVSGEMAPGDRLPPEKELSDALGLSRNSLREAVKALEVIGVLDVRRGDGTYVTSLTPSHILDAMSFFADVHSDDSVLELLEVRRILEPAAAALAARQVTPADIAHLRQLLSTVDETTPVDELVAQDIVFHRYISALSGNAYLTRLLDTLSGSTLRARVWRGLTEDGSVTRTLTEHHAIVDALEAGDPALVEAQVLLHVSGVTRWLRRALT